VSTTAMHFFFWLLTIALGIVVYHLIYSPKKKSVKGKTILITGCSSGIGKLMAKRFIKLGAKIVAWDHSEEHTKVAHAELAAIAGEDFIKSYVVDVSNKTEIYALAERTKKEIGKIDVVINNAGVVSGGRAWEVSDSSIERVIAVNTLGPMWITRAFLKDFMDQNSGHFVYISSMASTLGSPMLSDYCASKWAITGYAESIRLEMIAAHKDVHTTLVCPYYINTGMFHGVRGLNFLMRILDQNWVADQIVNAVLTNRTELYLPSWMGWSNYLGRALLPTVVRDKAFDILGVTRSMDKFDGKRRV